MYTQDPHLANCYASDRHLPATTSTENPAHAHPPGDPAAPRPPAVRTHTVCFPLWSLSEIPPSSLLPRRAASRPRICSALPTGRAPSPVSKEKQTSMGRDHPVISPPCQLPARAADRRKCFFSRRARRATERKELLRRPHVASDDRHLSLARPQAGAPASLAPNAQGPPRSPARCEVGSALLRAARHALLETAVTPTLALERFLSARQPQCEESAECAESAERAVREQGASKRADRGSS